MTAADSYVLITAVRDEEKTIGETIGSVVNQTLRPIEWVIVSDGSIDQTDAIIGAAASKHSWITFVRLPMTPGRSFAKMVAAINAGVKEIRRNDYRFIGLLDGDLRFNEDYFQKVLLRFTTEPSLGLAGGMVVDIGDDPNQVPRNTMDVPGAVQLFSRECYEAVGGYFPIPEGGFDAVACAHARMFGFRTMLVTELVVDHLKPRNISAGGKYRRYRQLGVRDYAIGYHPLFMAIKCIGRLRESPVIVSGLARCVGYFSRAVCRAPRVVTPAVVSHIRSEQMKRLGLARFTRSAKAR